MDYILKKRELNTCEKILDTVSQQPVDMDFTLPDYCADMEKILKCSLTPKIYTRNLSGGQLRVEGASLIRVIYCDSNRGAIRCCEQTLPFSATFPVNSDAADHIILTHTKSEYLNCRALTPRRLTIHGAFSLYATVVAQNMCSVCCQSDYNDLQVKTESQDICELCEFTQELANISEAVSVRTDKNLESIVRSELNAMLTDVSVTGDKIILKGEMTLRILYICDVATGETDRFVYVFPFTQALSAATPDTAVRDIRLQVLSYELLLRNELITDEPVVNLEAKLSVSLMGYKTDTITYIADAYSTCNCTELSSENAKFCSDIHTLATSSAVKTSVNLGDKNISRILDIFTEECFVNSSTEDSTLHHSGNVNVCILACTDEGEIISLERQVDVHTEESLQKAYSDVASSSCTVTSVSFRLGDDNSMELRLDVRFSTTVCNLCSFRQVTQVLCADNNSAASSCPLTLYYAHKGECVWEIAKRYRAHIDTLCKDNPITEDTLSDDQMLMIIRN